MSELWRRAVLFSDRAECSFFLPSRLVLCCGHLSDERDRVVSVAMPRWDILPCWVIRMYVLSHGLLPAELLLKPMPWLCCGLVSAFCWGGNLRRLPSGHVRWGSCSNIMHSLLWWLIPTFERTELVRAVFSWLILTNYGDRLPELRHWHFPGAEFPNVV